MHRAAHRSDSTARLPWPARVVGDCLRKRHAKPRHLVRFTQRELREAFAWGDFQLRRHLARLVELEYVLPHRTGCGNQRQYELLYDGQGRRGEPFLLGLADTMSLSAAPSEVRNDHLEGRNDAHSIGLRCPSDAREKAPQVLTRPGVSSSQSCSRCKNWSTGP